MKACSLPHLQLRVVVEVLEEVEVLALDDAVPAAVVTLEVADVVLAVLELDTLTEVEIEALRVLEAEEPDGLEVAEVGEPDVDEPGKPGEPAVAVFQ